MLGATSYATPDSMRNFPEFPKINSTFKKKTNRKKVSFRFFQKIEVQMYQNPEKNKEGQSVIYSIIAGFNLKTNPSQKIYTFSCINFLS